MKRAQLLSLEVIGRYYKLKLLEKEFYSTDLQQCLERLRKEIERWGKV